MMIMIKQKILPALLIAVSLIHIGSAIDSPQCSQAKDNLLNPDVNPELNNAIENMWKSFDRMCEIENSCIFNVDPVAATTHLNFEQMEGTAQYDNLREACEKLGTPEFPTSLCKVDSSLIVSNGATGTGAVEDKFTAKNEPVCFPYQCSHRQVDLVHGNPLGCDPEKTDCILEAEDAECGVRPEGAGFGNCNKHAGLVNQDETLINAINALSSKASMACVSFQTDDAIDPICTTSTKPISITLAQHMRKFEASADYDRYLEKCYDTGGQTCFMSMVVRMEGQVGFFNIDVDGDYNDYPACLPGDCTSEEKKDHMSRIISADVGQKIVNGMNEGFRRHLKSDVEIELHEAELDRLLQADDLCPGIGMEICDFTVIDFYCIARGTSTGPLTMGSSDATSSGITSASFAAAMGVAVAGGVLL